MKIFKYLLISILVLVGILLTMFYRKAYQQPYDFTVSKESIPTFQEVKFPLTNIFDNNKSLPIIGSAIIDVDNQGPPEVFIGGGYNQEDALFEFKNGEFVQIPDTGITKTLPDTTYGAATIDIDGNGYSDLLLARDSGVYLFTNSAGKFTSNKLDIKFNGKSTPVSFALGDINKDGFIDMYISTYLPLELMEGQNIFNKEGYGSTSVMLLNNGDNTFRDITRESGLHYVHNTFLGIFIDIDNDTNLDLVVAHDTGHIKTWKNLGNLKFEDIPNPTSPPVYGYPMGIAVGDYNNDGKPDFFFSNTGGTAPPFIAKGDLRDDQQYDDKLIFFRNDGDFKFTNVNEETLTADYEFSWGVVFHDFNLDGLQDLIISENYVDFPPHKIFRLPGRLLIQGSEHRFASTEAESGVVNRNYEITSLVADFNLDGYPDLIRVNLAGPIRAFINKGGDNNYLLVKLPDQVRSFGAVVKVILDNQQQLTDFSVAGEGLCSDQGRMLTFGLGQHRKVSSVHVQYADGTSQIIQDPKINTVLVLD